MRFFRLHIPKAVTTLILLAGIILYYVQPANNTAQNTAFTSWLSTHLKTHDNDFLLDKINELSLVDAEFETIIKNVSEFISQNSDSFDFGEKQSEKDDIYSYLLKEWASYMSSQQGMAKGVIITNSKVNGIQQKDTHSAFTPIIPKQQLSYFIFHKEIEKTDIIPYNTIPAPLSFGIVIGAP